MNKLTPTLSKELLKFVNHPSFDELALLMIDDEAMPEREGTDAALIAFGRIKGIRHVFKTLRELAKPTEKKEPTLKSGEQDPDLET